jgi:N6-L-threonylcarbamoyladenine synthase
MVVAGGVGANRLLREQFAAIQKSDQVEVLFAPPHLCTDNGVMIAWAAALHLLAGNPAAMSPGFTVRPRWPLSALIPETS